MADLHLAPIIPRLDIEPEPILLELLTTSAVSEPLAATRLPYLAQNHPNPFRPSTRIHFRTRVRGHVRIDILDVAGRRVASLVDDTLPAGEHVTGWDGRTSTGRAASPGMFFYRLTTADGSLSRKMILLK